MSSSLKTLMKRKSVTFFFTILCSLLFFSWINSFVNWSQLIYIPKYTVQYITCDLICFQGFTRQKCYILFIFYILAVASSHKNHISLSNLTRNSLNRQRFVSIFDNNIFIFVHFLPLKQTLSHFHSFWKKTFVGFFTDVKCQNRSNLNQSACKD